MKYLGILLFGYPVPPELLDPRYPALLQRGGGLLLTVLLTVVSMAIGFGLGVLLLAGRRFLAGRADPGERLLGVLVRGASAAFVVTVRGLPIMLLVLLVFGLPYPLLGLRVPGFVLAVAAFSVYAGVYLCESLRAGLRSVDPQLRPAGRVLGLTGWQVFRHVELPLIYRTMRPDLLNITVTVFKDTSVLAVVAVPELTYTGRQMIVAEPVNYGLLLLAVLLLYWAPATALSALAASVKGRQQ